MGETLESLLERAERELLALDEDRYLHSLEERYPKLLALAAELRDRHPATRQDDASTSDATDFIKREHARISRGDEPPWTLKEVMTTVRAPDGRTVEVHAMTVALVPIGSEDADIRDVLHSWFSRYGIQPVSD